MPGAPPKPILLGWGFVFILHCGGGPTCQFLKLLTEAPHPLLFDEWGWGEIL